MSENIPPAQRIWQAVIAIPYGKVATYGQIAEAAGFPRGARLAGRALKDLPENTRIPWHRVVNAAGKIALPEQSDKHLEQVRRLRLEGIRFNRDRISLADYRWQP